MSSLGREHLEKMDAYWRAANYLSVGQIYLKDNPLLDRPLTSTTSSLACSAIGEQRRTQFHLHPSEPADHRARPEHDVHHRSRTWRPRDRGANTYLEGSYTEIYPDIEQNRDGIKRSVPAILLAVWHSQPCRPETPGSIHEGGELGYSLAARLRRGIRQSRPDRRLRRRRRRGGDRSAALPAGNRTGF